MEPLRIVCIGGGTGLSALLHGLKAYAGEDRQAEITAVVTVTDDGGSSGRLRRDFDVLPPGDYPQLHGGAFGRRGPAPRCFSIVSAPAAASRATVSAISF